MHTVHQKTELLKGFKFRHACKEFDASKKIPKEDFDFILETGRLSPSSLGLEPWHFVILQNMEIREKLLPVSWGAQGQLPTASHFIVFLARNKDEMSYDSEYIEHIMKDIHEIPDDVRAGRREKVEDYQKNDAKMFDSKNGVFDWACKQVYIAMANMMTSAAVIGVDSCPIEGYDREKVEEILEKEGILDKSKFGVACMAAFGYRKERPKREKTRQEMDDIVTWVE
ncbi:NAD(P)H-dependent oxidoreductase [uncultured Clostridium sp.]|uniref:NAD(P)H-dependent oxidoreductase n=1 Tax=uncultured Clostridium sp. TaxID=59620 RepID=UPI002602DD8A|nr:NAD(P)H-dependent oxidoreductase [uncultured Clostridium sp.]